jgi:uncharacterized protein
VREDAGEAGPGWQVVIVAKAPVAGLVKTRLCPPLTSAQAASVAAAALSDTLSAAQASGAQRRVLALDGDPGPWVPSGFDVVAQRPGDFATRLAGALDDAWHSAPLPVLLIGMDTPQLDAVALNAAARCLLEGSTDTVLGPADDGGFWTLGARRPVDGLFCGVPMSTGETALAQLARLHALGLSCSLLPGLRDVDTIDDALAVAGQAPATRFASALAEVLAAGSDHVATLHAP